MYDKLGSFTLFNLSIEKTRRVISFGIKLGNLQCYETSYVN